MAALAGGETAENATAPLSSARRTTQHLHGANASGAAANRGRSSKQASTARW